MAEDDDYSQDSEAYRKWRSGEDNDRYASSKTPSETGARSGSYTTPKSENDENTVEEEGNDSRELPRWAWAVIFIPTLIFVIIASGAIDLQFGDGGTDGTNPSEWPSVEGTIENTFVYEQFITEEYCEDINDDGYFDDDECWKEFVYIAEVSYFYTVDDTSDVNGQEGCEGCFHVDIVELWESHWVDVLKREGEDKLFQEFINATDERLAVNSTVKIFYNPENAGEAYSEFEVAGEAYGEFVELNEDAESGFILTGFGAIFCSTMAIVLTGIFLGTVQRIRGIGEDYELNRGGSFGVFESDNNRSGGRNSRAVRRSGGSSRSGGGGRSGSGSRSGRGGGRSGSGGRRR